MKTNFLTHKQKTGFLLALLSLVASFTLAPSAFAEEDCGGDRSCELRTQISALNSEIDSFNNKLAELQKQSGDLKADIERLGIEQDKLRKEIELKQAEHDRLVLEIESTRKRISDNNEAIGYAIAQYYYSEENSTIERLASSDSFSAFLDQEVNLSSISDTLMGIVEENKKLEAELNQEKVRAEQILADLDSQKEQLAAKQAEQQTLLAQTEKSANEVASLKDQKDSERAKLLQEQAEINRQNLGTGGVTPGDPSKGGYPYSNVCPAYQDAYSDPWGMYICECVSYAAWKVQQNYGNMPYWGGRGNANQWPANARAAGIPVSYTPKAGTVGIMMAGYYGHAVWIEAVSADGSQVYISQYNAWNAATNYTWGEYSEQWVNANAFVYIYFGG